MGLEFFQRGGDEKRMARFRLAELQSSGTRAVDRIDECEVVHRDLLWCEYGVGGYRAWV